jgi:BMFP domain-containing protein YqiC
MEPPAAVRTALFPIFSNQHVVHMLEAENRSPPLASSPRAETCFSDDGAFLMREPPTRLFDELSRVMTGAVGIAQGVQKEADSFAKSQIERILRDSDFVSREEFEAVRAMAIAARDENDRLAARLAELEAAIATKK